MDVMLFVVFESDVGKDNIILGNIIMLVEDLMLLFG